MQTNQLYYGDNLDILRAHIPDESVDLIYEVIRWTFLRCLSVIRSLASSEIRDRYFTFCA